MIKRLYVVYSIVISVCVVLMYLYSMDLLRKNRSLEDQVYTQSVTDRIFYYNHMLLFGSEKTENFLSSLVFIDIVNVNNIVDLEDLSYLQQKTLCKAWNEQSVLAMKKSFEEHMFSQNEEKAKLFITGVKNISEFCQKHKRSDI